MHVQIDRPTCIAVSPHGRDAWVPSQGPTNQVDLDDPKTGSWDIRLSGNRDWWTEYAQDVNVPFSAGSQPPTIQLTQYHYRMWPFLVVTGAAMLGAAGVFVSNANRRVRAARAEQEETERTTQVAGPSGDPERIGRYRVLERLGQGGMAEVFKVEAPDKGVYALKVPLPHVRTDQLFLNRFSREMRLGTALVHPNLVRILDTGFVRIGGQGFDNPFLVMEFIDGAPLAEPTASCPWRDSLELGVDVLDALEYIHGKGVIHRDLKPGNIMRTHDGRIKLMDFGVAHNQFTIGGRLTATDQIVGTPMYMAIEQLNGQPVTGRVDIYALGVLLYERLTGKPPFTGDIFQIITTKLSSDLPPLAEARPDLPAPVSQAIMRMAATQPDDRFPDAASARTALQSLL
jgi:hypothetical protein